MLLLFGDGEKLGVFRHGLYTLHCLLCFEKAQMLKMVPPVLTLITPVGYRIIIQTATSYIPKIHQTFLSH